MKTSTAILVIAAAAAPALAQSVADFPSCARSCAFSSLKGTPCQITDFKCVCTNQAYISAVTTCVAKACSAADQAKNAEVSEGLCKAEGVTIQVSSMAATSMTSAASSGSSASSGASMPTSSTSAGAVAGKDASSKLESSGSMTSGTATVTGSMTSSSSASGTDATSSGSATSSSSDSSSTGAAADVKVGMGMLALMGVALL